MALLRLVDPENGYRYYREDQLELGRLIGLLRRLEMPLALIAEVLEGRQPSKVSAPTGMAWRPIYGRSASWFGTWSDIALGEE